MDTAVQLTEKLALNILTITLLTPIAYPFIQNVCPQNGRLQLQTVSFLAWQRYSL